MEIVYLEKRPFQDARSNSPSFSFYEQNICTYVRIVCVSMYRYSIVCIDFTKYGCAWKAHVYDHIHITPAVFPISLSSQKCSSFPAAFVFPEWSREKRGETYFLTKKITLKLGPYWESQARPPHRWSRWG